MALFELHGALSRLGSKIPPPTYGTEITDAIHSLNNQEFAPELRGEDRNLLLQALNSGKEAFAQLHDTYRSIHGSPRGMNTLVVAGEPRFIDFETVELGPLEWDLAHLEPEARDHYPIPFDARAVAVCRLMVSATTSTWCWAGPKRGPDMRSHAEHHPAIVRSALD